jgi:GT2 family glycosyltransferase/glycosyltransferase involved in cell wall biosynthesis
VQVCTVINKAWIAHARALAASLAEHDPKARLAVLIVDPLEGRLDPDAEPFEVLSPEQIELAWFEELTVRYDVTELCCALKPAVMLHLLAAGEQVVYLDSDVRVYAPLETLTAELADAGLVLTPHLLAPLPDDGRDPDDRAILLGGAFNMGVAAAAPGPETTALLEWWSARLRTGSRLEPDRGLVYDQRWAELMPGLAEHVAICRDPGVNFGYWRAPAARLEKDGERYLVDGVPLRALHFTGVDTDRPASLSRYDNRTDLEREPVLRELRDGFNASLRALGHEESSKWPYSYGRTAGGIPLDAALRRLWDRAKSSGAVDRAPFSAEGEEELLDWADRDEPAAEGAPLSRWLQALIAGTAPLSARFPDPRGADHAAVLAWAAEEAEREPGGMLGRLAARAQAAASSRAGLSRLAPGESLGAERGETVVCIPVYGAVEELAECLASVLEHTPPDCRVLIADDATPDPGVEQLLVEFEQAGRLSRHEVSYMRQPANLGFPGNVNTGFAAAAPADVVVLNSDCVVAAGWLQGLERAARSDALIATASALTNHGTILSVPYRNVSQPDLPSDQTLTSAAAEVLRTSLRIYPRLPTAVGHCMLVRRHALDLVGPFDTCFSPGYGEEVDFSQRCLLSGLVHVAADDVLVLHRGGASLGDDGVENPVRLEHEAIIESRYPYYQRAQTTAGRSSGTPLARALSSARRSILGRTATIDARCLGPIVTGTQIHTLEVIRALSETGIVSVRVVVPTDLGDHARDVLEGLSHVSLISHTQVGPDMGRSDVAHRPYQVSSRGDLALLAHAGERTVITQQDLIAYRNPGYFPGYPQWQAYQRLTREALALADRVAFFSDHATRDAIREELVEPERAKLVYIGVDHPPAAVAPQRPKGVDAIGERPMLLCLGTDFRHKNRVFALRLIEALRTEEGWDGTLVLAGPRVAHGSSAPEEARFLATRPELAANVVTLPAVNEAEKTWLMERCTAVLYPTTFEGFGLMPFEAAAAGRPCLFASHTALAETLPAELATLVPWDARASAKSSLRLIADSEARERHIREIAHAGTRFSWSVTGEQLVDLYAAAAAAPAREAARLAADLLDVEQEREENRRKYDELWGSLNSDARALVAPDGPLQPADTEALAAMARRPLTRRLLFAPLRALHRIAGRREPAEKPTTPPEAFSLHFGFSNREHMEEQLAGGSEPREESSRDWLG